MRENSEAGAFVAHLSVVDADSGDNGRVHCAVNHPAFVLEQIYASELKVGLLTLSLTEIDTRQDTLL